MYPPPHHTHILCLKNTLERTLSACSIIYKVCSQFHVLTIFGRDEQYRSLWTELENLTQVYCKNSDRHQTLLSFLQDVMSHCASIQVARKTPSAANNSKGTCKSENREILTKNICLCVRYMYLGMT